MVQIGLDIGGTKIVGAVFAPNGEKQAQRTQPTPSSYEDFLSACRTLSRELEEETKMTGPLGVCFPGGIDYQAGTAEVANIPYLNGKLVLRDLEKSLEREVRFQNDANCIALAESHDGAGQGARSVLGITLSTGVGSGYIVDGKVINGANGLAGEIGHLPLPFREPEDGPVVDCFCGQKGCIEKSICGGALSRLYAFMTGRQAKPEEIAALASTGDSGARAVLDRYYEVVAKAMIAALHSFDPEVIVVTGGLSNLSALFDEVPKRWGKYCVVKNPKTRFLKAAHGPLASLRGASLLWKEGM